LTVIEAAVIDMHTIKPLDTDLVLEYMEKTGAVVTCENGQRSGGLGGAVAELSTEYRAVPVIRIGIDDQFGQVGSEDYLLRTYDLGHKSILAAAMKAVRIKQTYSS